MTRDEIAIAQDKAWDKYEGSRCKIWGEYEMLCHVELRKAELTGNWTLYSEVCKNAWDKYEVARLVFWDQYNKTLRALT